MRDLGLRGVVRGRRVKTTVPSEVLDRPMDRVNREFQASRPNALWVADITFVATWRGFVYVAFVIDAFARQIVGWRVSSSLQTDIALDALEQALYDRGVNEQTDLIHHSDRGVCSIYPFATPIAWLRWVLHLRSAASVTRTTTRWRRPSTGCTRAEVIRQQGPWRNLEDVEFATLGTWVDWFNNRRLLEPIGNVPPAELEAAYYEQLEGSAMAA